jgi:hypothetical protein
MSHGKCGSCVGCVQGKQGVASKVAAAVQDILQSPGKPNVALITGTPYSIRALDPSYHNCTCDSCNINLCASVGFPWLTGAPDLVCAITSKVDLDTIGKIMIGVAKAIEAEQLQQADLDGKCFSNILDNDLQVKLRKVDRALSAMHLSVYRTAFKMLNTAKTAPVLDIYQIVMPEKEGTFKAESTTWQVLLQQEKAIVIEENKNTIPPM